MNLAEYQNLDPNQIGTWPLPLRAAIIAAVCAATLWAGWHFDIEEQTVLLEDAQAQEVTLRKTLEKKQHKAANLEPLKAQLEEMKQTFGDLLRQLPSKTEVAALLVDISQQGLASGLEFKLFEPDKENNVEFYAELPIKIEVTGSYHQFGEFISGVAALPRIVTQHDINITAINDADPETLKMTTTAKTYRYLEEEEE